MSKGKFQPSEVFKTISGSRRAGPVRKNGDLAWVEKVAPNGTKYRIQVYGLVGTGCYHDHASFNTYMSVLRAGRIVTMAHGREAIEEDHRWQGRIRANATAGTTFVARPALRPSEISHTEKVRSSVIRANDGDLAEAHNNRRRGKVIYR